MDLDKDSDVPQWKKDLIARLRNQNRHTSVADGGEENYGQQQQLSSGPSQPQPQPLAVQQPTPTCTDSSSESSRGGAALEKCNAATSKMVQEKAWIDNLKMVSEKYSNGVHRKDSDSDSSEDLHYGPGIVNKLKNKYLSLALRESNNRTRPSILRKAASLENILDDEVPNGNKSENRLFQGRVNGCSENAKNVPNRYRSATRGLELKRARSVEAISMSHHDENKIENNRQSLHEDMLLISEGNDKPFSKKHDKIVAETGNSDKQKYTNVGRVNRPKRVAPMMNEREKPPADVVKQKKLIFERRPETRTKPPISTGDVAAKVDTYNSIIVKAKASKKPLIKHKPVINDKKPPAPQPRAPKIIANDDKVAKNKPKSLQVNKVPKSALMSPIPDVSRIDFPNQKGDKEKQLSETPDLILTSSPILAPGSPTFKKSTEQFLNEEIRVCSPDGNIFASPKVSPTANDNVDSPGKIIKAAGTAVFNFSNAPVEQSHLPINKNVSTAKTPLEKPLKIDVNGFGHNDAKKVPASPNEVISPTIRKAKLESPKANLTTTEIEKNLINTAKSSSASVSPPKPAASAVPEVSKNVVVPKVKRAQEPTSTTAVFNFTARKDVPDYISNDRMGKSKKSDDDLRKRKTEQQRKRRELAKKNPEKYEKEKEKERQRYHKRKTEGKIKGIEELTPRQQRIKRKTWKECSYQYRQKNKKKKQAIIQFIHETTPPATPEPYHGQPQQEPKSGPSRASMRGRKKVRRDRAKAYRELKKVKNELSKTQRRLNKYKTKYFRLKQDVKKDSPNTKVNKLIKGVSVPLEVKKKLLFNEVLISQISENYKEVKDKSNRQKFREVLLGKDVRKYRCLGQLNFMTYKVKRSRNADKAKGIKKIKLIKGDITSFIEKDEYSRLCPGKKDTITRNGVKKQKRLLNKSLLMIYNEFRQSVNYFISYSTFCKLRPFWVLHPKINRRDTCLCTVCENGELLVRKLKLLSIIEENCLERVCKSVCCNNETKENCLNNRCTFCFEKKLHFNPYQAGDLTFYEKWITKTVEINIKGEIKNVKKTIKEKIHCTKGQMIEVFEIMLPKLLKHIYNRNHQYKEIDKMKVNLKEGEVVVHMDFSENFACKYSAEIQSMHFGGSRQQVSLHTVVVYYKSKGNLKKESICTMSDSLRHNPEAILVHLKAVFKLISEKLPRLSTIHFISDGPSTQYRNCKMFQIIGSLIKSYLPGTLNSIIWNYTERGHGKGAPDGVGGCVKRTADSLIAMGHDIENFTKLVDMVSENMKKIKIVSVPQQEIESLKLNMANIKPFKGTLQVHQVIWMRNKPGLLKIRRLSCYNCPLDSNCPDYHLGDYYLKENLTKEADLHNIYSDSEDQQSEHIDHSPNERVKFGINQFLLAKLPGKKRFKYYVGVVLSIETKDSETDMDIFTVKFLRRKDHTFTFVYPEKEDISEVYMSEIEHCLPFPEIDNRNHYVFHFSFEPYSKDLY
ncbi:unnamed protein product [Brassicogethes aeneus]|uniref:Uncharacterized protein n=1 Tax=Brassicogethes aeneus TaxID=1431903 RepID=A0A9P0FGI9_BRAAE|nr:unnamed protein product [Brassicogethes aeneus]